ncbi:MAG: TolC family protein [Kiritimatiellae bacterium]|nr:TolC family protein [Kiritimatiellia bacterium]
MKHFSPQSPSRSIAKFCDALGHVLTLLARLAVSRERHALARGRLTMPQMCLLDHCASVGPCTMGEIAAAFRLRRSTLTQIVDRLAERGLVTRRRASCDRRRVLVQMTPAGRRLVRSFRLERRRTLRALFAEVPHAQRRVFLRILEHAADAFSAGTPPRAVAKARRATTVVFALAAVTRAGEVAALRRLTLDDCLRSGLERSVAVANAERDRLAASAMIAEMRAPLLPELHTRADYTRRNELDTLELDGPPVTFGRLDNYTAAVELRQLLYDGGSVAAGLKAARVYRDRVDLASERVRETLARDIHLAFHALWYLEEAVRVQTATIVQLDEFANEIEHKHREGVASEFDAMAARVRAANERPTLAALERERCVARAAFRNLARLETDQFELAGEGVISERTADLTELETAVRIALQQRHELHEQQKLVELRATDLRVERGAYSPVLRARGSYEGRNPETFISSEDRWEWDWQVGLTVEWSLYDGGRRAARIQQKELALASAQAELEELQRRIRLEVEEAWMRRREAAQANEAAEQTVRLADRSVEIAHTRVQTGLATRLEFTDAMLAQRRARLQLLGARRDLRSADVRLAYAIGRSLLPRGETTR